MPPAAVVEELRAYVEQTLEPVAAKIARIDWQCAAGTSKMFRTLARLAGAAPSAGGLWSRRTLTRTGLRQVLGFIQHIPPSRLSELEGVAVSRSHQVLAGAVVAEAVMRQLDLESLEICPWALREGVILRRLDQLAAVAPEPARIEPR